MGLAYAATEPSPSRSVGSTPDADNRGFPGYVAGHAARRRACVIGAGHVRLAQAGCTVPGLEGGRAGIVGS